MYDDLRQPYQSKEFPALTLGAIMVNDKLIDNAPVMLLLKSFNRHGLINGATGSGKTKTIQVLCEQLAQAGVPCFVMDIKGDLSGLAAAATTSKELQERNATLSLDFSPKKMPVELLTLNGEAGCTPIRSPVHEFGSLLFSRLLDLNETQASVINALFQYAKEEQIPLVTLNDLKDLLQFSQTKTGQDVLEGRYGAIASTSLGIILRKLIDLEAQGGAQLFGLPAFDVNDLLRVNSAGQGVISILRLLDIQDKPKVFSTFMLKLLNDLYQKMPELGDPSKPKLVLFFDEAHLLFQQASKALLSRLDTTVKLIRSKGIGLIFCTQVPDDIPENILSQLGLKIQHSLRAFTAKDRKSMKLIAQNFPLSTYYATEQILTSLGIGETLLCALDAEGQPTPLIQCKIRSPETRMGVLSTAEINQTSAASSLHSKYDSVQEGVRASTVLTDKTSSKAQPVPKQSQQKEEPSIINTLSKNTLFRQVTRQIVRDLMSAVMSALGIKKKR
jgi:DNA helicase HerA-like ATPase